MAQIHRALQEGVLLDITDNQAEIKTEYSRLSAVNASDRPEKVFFGRRQDFLKLGLASLADLSDEDRTLNDLVCVGTSDPEEIRLIEAQIEEKKRQIVLPPGMDDPEKYLLK